MGRDATTLNGNRTMLAMGDPQVWILLAGVVILIFFLMRANRRRWTGGGASGTASTRQSLPTRQAADAAIEQLEELMAQLAELARETSAQIETRSAKLELLLDEADAKIKQIEALAVASTGAVVSPQPAPLEAPPAVKPEHRQVHELADAGQTPVQIASQLGRDVGEIELILALRRKS